MRRSPPRWHGQCGKGDSEKGRALRSPMRDFTDWHNFSQHVAALIPDVELTGVHR
jgi:hypothetical protein